MPNDNSKIPTELDKFINKLRSFQRGGVMQRDNNRRWANEQMEANADVPFVSRIINKDSRKTVNPYGLREEYGPGTTSTHRLGTFEHKGHNVYPNVYAPDNKSPLRDSVREGEHWVNNARRQDINGNLINFDNFQDADRFAHTYKDSDYFQDWKTEMDKDSTFPETGASEKAVFIDELRKGREGRPIPLTSKIYRQGGIFKTKGILNEK